MVELSPNFQEYYREHDLGVYNGRFSPGRDNRISGDTVNVSLLLGLYYNSCEAGMHISGA